MEAAVESVDPVPEWAGIFTIQVRVPALTDFGDAVPVDLRVSTPDGKQTASNQVTVAVEPVSQ